MRNRRFALVVGALLLCLLGALGGWKLRGEVRTSAAEDLRSFSVLEKGDAPAPVRAEVLRALRLFQDGYVRRDPAQLDAFMQALFGEGDSVLLLGTDSSEWRGGSRPVSDFIRSDWRSWGDVRIGVEDAIISSRGDVAWVATVGQVGLGKSPLPLRFSAVLTRRGGGWLFRQVQFQQVQRPMSLSEVLGARTLLGRFKKKTPTSTESMHEK